jgi:hypothetical protein
MSSEMGRDEAERWREALTIAGVRKVAETRGKVAA